VNWEYKTTGGVKEEQKRQSNEFLKEIEGEIEGKSVSQHKIKDVACTAICLFLTTGKGICGLKGFNREWGSYYWESTEG